MMDISKIDRKTYRLTAEQWFPRPLDEVFAFFSKPANLEELTPDIINFHILTPDVIMEEGAEIEYQLKLKGLPIRWKTEIPVWDPPHRFIDNQAKGPYKKWVHEHIFSKKDEGTRVKDIVDYQVPGGGIVHRLFVEPDVRTIFTYRQQKLTELFGTTST